MQFRAEQMRELDERARQAGNLRLAAYVEERFPRAFADRDAQQREAIVERMRVAAAAFGLQRDDHVGAYITLHLMYGPGFESQPWAAPVLRSTVLNAQEKIRTLQRRVQQAGVAL